jgi:hypothetical protein
MMRWGSRVVTACFVWVVLVGYGWLAERETHYLALTAAVAAVMTVVWLCTDAYAVALPPEWHLYYTRSPARSFDPRFSRLSQELAEASDRRAAALAVHSSVEKVADVILVDKYGIDRAADPQAAGLVLGEETMDYLAANPERERDVFSDRLFHVLERLESL